MALLHDSVFLVGGAKNGALYFWHNVLASFSINILRLTSSSLMMRRYALKNASKSFCTQGQSFWPCMASSPTWGSSPDFMISLSTGSDLCSHSHLGASSPTRGWVTLPSRVLVFYVYVYICFAMAKQGSILYSITHIQHLWARPGF
jgi:hypothetical protein